ncbi:MAG: copper amine oxidase N-terminal domain-containing protein [Fimbriimonadaceae bacterium]|nr:copper amine oxidase N-terminal domain-containing protein [Fimbriimonadaceae bacterium]
MRKLKFMSAVAMFAFAGSVGAQMIRTTIDGKAVSFHDVQPMMMNGRVMVPWRGVLENLGATVNWNPAARSVTAEVPGTTVRMFLGSNEAWVNGEAVALDTPATIYRGRTMVPLRFISESLGNDVTWVAQTRTVEINTGALDSAYYNEIDHGTGSHEVNPNGRLVSLDARTVIPFKLDTRLDSDTAYRGKTFTATLDAAGGDYLGLPDNTRIEGHVDSVKKRDGATPGVLGLTFDTIRLPNGNTYAVYGSLTSLDEDSVEHRDDGRMVAKMTSKDNLKYVGYGAGGGALIAILTKGNVLSNSLIGGALGYLYNELVKAPDKAHDVHLKAGTEFGVRLDRDLVVRAGA